MKVHVAQPKLCAAEILETVPLLMSVLRAHSRSASSPELSIPQFRALAFVGRNQGGMLCDVASFLGLTPPSASKLIDGLVAKRLLLRYAGTTDRRSISLSLTAAGRKIYERAVQSAEKFLADHLSQLAPSVLEEMRHSLEVLRSIFQPLEVRKS